VTLVGALSASSITRIFPLFTAYKNVTLKICSQKRSLGLIRSANLKIHPPPPKKKLRNCLSIYCKIPPGGFQLMSFGGKHLKRRRKKGGNPKYKRKQKNGERKMTKGEEKEKIGSKRVK
jgi:hypothetical protein